MVHSAVSSLTPKVCDTLSLRDLVDLCDAVDTDDIFILLQAEWYKSHNGELNTVSDVLTMQMLRSKCTGTVS